MKGRVLIVAGSDSGGGAGIQADIKTVTALGGYAATAVTALTAQNTCGVFGIVGVEPAFIAQQMELVLEDIGADCIKTGMLHTAEVIETVAGVLETKAPGVPRVVDPVMVAKGGDPLLEPQAETALRSRLIPLADVLTPNIREAERLTGVTIENDTDMRKAADCLRVSGAKAVVLKGGRLPDGRVLDLLVHEAGSERLTSAWVDSGNTHGSGCTFASAIATGCAQGLSMEAAVRRAHAYVHEAIRRAPGLGRGHGPLAHTHTVAGYPVPPFES